MRNFITNFITVDSSFIFPIIFVSQLMGASSFAYFENSTSTRNQIGYPAASANENAMNQEVERGYSTNENSINGTTFENSNETLNENSSELENENSEEAIVGFAGVIDQEQAYDSDVNQTQELALLDDEGNYDGIERKNIGNENPFADPTDSFDIRDSFASNSQNNYSLKKNKSKNKTKTRSSSMSGNASYYGPGFNGRKTCTGEKYNQNAMTLAAHKWHGEKVCVQRIGARTAKMVTATINDCGPFHNSRIVDLSIRLMKHLAGNLKNGVIKVKVTRGSCQ